MLLSTNSAMSQIPVVEILWGGFEFGLRRTTRPAQWNAKERLRKLKILKNSFPQE